jgi:hypothetical protein
MISWAGRLLVRYIRSWILIRNRKPIVLFERHCQATEKSEAIACCKEMPVIPVNRVVDPKRKIEKMEGRGGGEAQGVADPKKQERFLQLFSNTPAGFDLTIFSVAGGDDTTRQCRQRAVF